jgi:DNA-binding CsgD family transcriptional regulator
MQAHPSSASTAGRLVGRDREQAMLRAALDAALAGRGSLVLLGGEAGIGKTALAEALLAEATAQVALALVGRCYDLAETPPYGPWSEALARAPREGDLPALPSALRPPGHGGEVLTSQAAIVRRVWDYLAALAARQPLVLLLEDLHWGDPASLDLLRVVARGLADLPLLVLSTYRADEVAGEHPLATLFPALVREARAERLDLHPLDEAAIAALVAARYEVADADRARLVAYLAARSDGNALFLSELLRTLEADGTLRRAPGTREAGGRWMVGDLAAVPIPGLLRQVIGGRVARLGEASQRLLVVAAVIGQEVPLGLWAAVAETDEDGLLETIERGTAARLLLETPDGGGMRFAHALVREALYEATPLPRRRAWHRRAGEALAARPAPDPDAVATHFRRAGDPRAATWLRRAGERAQRVYAWLTAAERYEAALAMLVESGGDAHERVWLLLARARLLRYSAPRRCIPLLEEGIRLAREAGDEALAAVTLCDAGIVRCSAGDLRSGLAQLAVGLAAQEAMPRAEPVGTPSPAVSGTQGEGGIEHYRAMLAYWLARVGRLVEADRLAEVVLPSGLVRAHQARAYVLAGYGQPAAAAQSFARTREIYFADGNAVEGGAVDFQTWLWLGLPYWADRVAWRREMAAAGVALHAVWVAHFWTTLQPVGHLIAMPLAGEWHAARALALRAAEGGDGHVGIRLFALWAIAPIVRAQGDAALADTIVRSIFPDGPGTEPGGHLFQEAITLQRLAAALALDAGDLATARAWLEAHDRWLAWSGAIPGRAEGELCWAAYHRAAGDPVVARERAEGALRQASAPRQPLALLAAHRLLGEMDTAASRRAAAQGHLDAALALADACAAPYERALTLLALAELRAAERQPAAATALLAEARGLLEPLDARPALARAAAIAARLADDPVLAHAALPFGLTAREAEVLRLVAEGRTDREIADRLSLSVRTVSNHVAHILSKTGAENRTALAALALRHGAA